MGFADMGAFWVSLERTDRPADTRGYTGRFVKAKPAEPSALRAVVLLMALPGTALLVGACVLVNLWHHFPAFL